RGRGNGIRTRCYDEVAAAHRAALRAKRDRSAGLRPAAASFVKGAWEWNPHEVLRRSCCGSQSRAPREARPERGSATRSGVICKGGVGMESARGVTTKLLRLTEP